MPPRERVSGWQWLPETRATPVALHNTEPLQLPTYKGVDPPCSQSSLEKAPIMSLFSASVCISALQIGSPVPFKHMDTKGESGVG